MRRLKCSCVLLWLILLASSEARGQFAFNPIAVTDEPKQIHVPTVGESPMTFQSFSNVMITADGEVAFAGAVIGAMGLESGLWTQAFPSPLLHLMAPRYNSATLEGCC
jgi:hypothetical protein